MKKSQSNFAIANKSVLIGLTVVCFGLIGISASKTEVLVPAKNAIGYILVPMQKGINYVGTLLYDKGIAARDMWDALEENKELKLKIEDLTEENSRLNNQKLELARLQELYELDQTYLDYEKVGARVIGKDSGSWFHVFRIDKGSDDGIQIDQTVIADGGLVGIVIDTAANYATVRSIIDDFSNVSAMTLSNDASCIVSGDLTLFEKGSLKLAHINKEVVIEDDEKIVTSNISDKYLPGILIGYAKNIKIDPNNLTQSGEIIPVADFKHLHEVLVITKIKETGIGESP